MTDRWKIAAWTVAIISAMLGAMSTQADALGLTVRGVAVISVIQSGIAVVQLVLPQVQGHRSAEPR